MRRMGAVQGVARGDRSPAVAVPLFAMLRRRHADHGPTEVASERRPATAVVGTTRSIAPTAFATRSPAA